MDLAPTFTNPVIDRAPVVRGDHADPARAQQAPKKIPLIGYLSPLSAASDAPRRAGFQQGLRELGYIEGQNIAVEYRFADGKTSRLPELAAELTRARVKLIIAGGGSLIARSAKSASATIPIVMTNVENPVADGLVKSLSHPGGNITGLTALLPDLAGKRVELLREAITRLARVAVVWNSTVTEKLIEFKETESTGKAFNIEIESLDVRSASDVDAAFGKASKNRIGAILVLPDPVINTSGRQIIELTRQRRWPSMFSQTAPVELGGTMSYGPSYGDLFRRAATYVDKILKGAKPADLPVEQPTRFELVINLKAAKQIGVTIPPQVLARADRVIR